MSELQVAWLELIIVGGIGVILALTGIITKIVIKKQHNLCTEKTNGVVIKYGFPGGGRMYPILEYIVDGNYYRAKKKFRGVIIKRISGIAIGVQSKAYEDEKGWLHVKMGPIANLRQLAEQMWPIDSKMTVYYNPNKHKKCYVDRPISAGGFATTMFIVMGLLTIILSLLVFFLIQL